MPAAGRRSSPPPAAVPLIGRDRELAALSAHITRAAEGLPTVLLFSGPPGVGKTRLARAVLDRAAQAGYTALSGRAHPLGHDVAFAALVEAFGPLLRPDGPAGGADLAAGLPQLGLVFSALPVTPPAPLHDPALERSRMLTAFTDLVARLARRAPVALLIDDVHLADASTIGLLAQLTIAIADLPVLLLLTARPDEPGERQIAELRLGLARSGWSFEDRAVTPLDDAGAAELVEAVLGAPVDPELVARITARCAGRPFFLDAVARDLLDSGRLHVRDHRLRLSGGAGLPLPHALRAPLESRLARSGADETAVLELLAVAGAEVHLEVLRHACGLDTDRLVAALDVLHHRGLLQQETRPGSYDLVHDLLRDAVLDRLSPVAVQRLHGRLVAALEATGPDDPRIAEHVLAGGALVDSSTALEQLARWGAQARAVGAVDTATRYLRGAAELAARQGRDDVAAEVQTALAAVLRHSGRPDEAELACRAALDAHRRIDNPAGVASCEQELGLLRWALGDLPGTEAHLDAAEAALSGLEPSLAHADLLYSRTVVAARIGDRATVARTAPRLRELAGRLGSPALQAQAHLAEAVLAFTAGDYIAMQECNRQALSAAQAGGDPLLVIRAHDQRSVAAASQLELPELLHASEASLAAARELGAVILQPWPRMRLAAANLLGGEWDAALRESSEMIALAQRHGEQRCSVSSFAARAWILTHLGRLSEARSYLQRAQRAAHPMLDADRSSVSIMAIAGSWLALTEGDAAAAADWAAQLSDTTGGWLPLLGLAQLGEAYARIGHAERAREVACRLRRVKSCSTAAPTVLADFVDGVNAAQRAEPAAALLTAAAAGFDTLGLVFHSARCRLEAALSIAGSGESLPLAGAALETFDALGAPVQARQARDLIARLGGSVQPGRARRPIPRDGEVKLSPRELEVARLVAAGLTNAEVAGELFISPRTVTTHLERIYTRLGLGSRVALTRYLADSGLLD